MSFHAGLRASGNGATSTIVPTRMSIAVNLSISIMSVIA